MRAGKVFAHLIVREYEKTHFLFVACAGCGQFTVITVLPHCSPQEVCQILVREGPIGKCVCGLPLSKNAKHGRTIFYLRCR